MTYIRDNGIIGIRPMTYEDSALIVKWRNQDWVRNNYIYRETFTLEGQQAYYRSKVETGQVVQFIVCTLADDRPIGCTVFSDVEPGVTAEFGMFLGERDAVGHGYSPEMVRMSLDYGFREMGLQEVHSRVMFENVASLTGADRGGLHMYATDRNVTCSDGSVHDFYLIRTTKEEFYGN